MANGAPDIPTDTAVTAQIDSLKNSQIAASTSALGASRDAALSGLNVESAKIAPQYYQSRNVASTQSQLGAKNFAEFLANRGQTNSGLAGQAQMSNDAALQGQIGVLNTAETAANSDITHRQADTNNTYNSGVATATAQAEAQAMTARIAEYQREVTAAALKQQQDAQMAEQVRQFNVDQAYKQQALAQSAQQAALARRASAAKAVAPKATAQNKVNNTNDVQAEIQKQINNGVSPGNVQMSLESQAAALSKAGVSLTDAIKYIYNYAGIETTPGEL